ncbi:MAG: hypothetical protein ACRCVX_16565 [Shewanella sp.]
MTSLARMVTFTILERADYLSVPVTYMVKVIQSTSDGIAPNAVDYRPDVNAAPVQFTATIPEGLDSCLIVGGIYACACVDAHTTPSKFTEVLILDPKRFLKENRHRILAALKTKEDSPLAIGVSKYFWSGLRNEPISIFY